TPASTGKSSSPPPWTSCQSREQWLAPAGMISLWMWTAGSTTRTSARLRTPASTPSSPAPPPSMHRTTRRSLTRTVLTWPRCSVDMSALMRLFGGALPQLVMSDLEGTLVDSVPDLAAAVDQLLALRGRLPAGVERVRDWVG